MELFFLKQLTNSSNNTRMEKSVNRLIISHRAQLLATMKRKAWLIRLSWVFSIGGGVSSGLATLSALKLGIAAFAILSVIPGGVLIALAACAAIGYTLLLYQSLTDMVQEYGGKWRDYFKKNKNESLPRYIFRMSGMTLAVGLGVFVTLATAGTWWYAVKHGAELISLGNKLAGAVRSISVVLMALPMFVFETVNSITSVNDMSGTAYLAPVRSIIAKIRVAWRQESLLRFLNPFRLIEKVITTTARGILFLGHVISMGLMSDNFGAVPATATVAISAAAEFLTDDNYLRGRPAKLVTALLLPVVIVTSGLKFLATLWDLPFTRNWNRSWAKMFGTKNKEISCEPLKPQLSSNWRKQEVMIVCDNITARLKTASPEKVAAARAIKTLVGHDDELNDDPAHIEEINDQLRELSAPLTRNRHHFWQQPTPKSKQEMDIALNGYFARRNTAS